MLRLGLLFAFFVFAVTALPTFVYEGDPTSSVRKSIHERDLTDVLNDASALDVPVESLLQITEINDNTTSEQNKPNEEKSIDVLGSTIKEVEGTVSAAANNLTNFGEKIGSVASVFENNKAAEGAYNDPNPSNAGAYAGAPAGASARTFAGAIAGAVADDITNTNAEAAATP